ncbi:hypothetical protein NKW55_15550 [Gluconobacter kondonii]|uniref:hypothetical protein n=1 Tax=Gluconobacter kondonii TaxID=941463 RepID=UPI00209DB9CA|nr:hypothetical protein [Gluconobacter kondonii]MCP1237956.1 hypothetical protein [Gluconobacter kondonii]
MNLRFIVVSTVFFICSGGARAQTSIQLRSCGMQGQAKNSTWKIDPDRIAHFSNIDAVVGGLPVDTLVLKLSTDLSQADIRSQIVGHNVNGRIAGPLSPSVFWMRTVSAATVTCPDAYAPTDLSLPHSVAGNAMGQTGPVNLASQMLPPSVLGTQAVSFAQGNASAASSLASGTMRARSFARRGADFINMADSLVLNGHGNSSGDPSPNTDPSVWQALRNQWGGDKIVTLPSGYIPPSDLNAYAIEAPTSPDATNKNVFYFAPSGLNVLGANGATYGRTLIDTDNDTTITPFNGSLRFEKHTISALVSNPIINLVYENSSPNIAQTGGGGMFNKLPPISVSAYQDPAAMGSLTGMSFWLVDQSDGITAPMLNQSQIFDGTIIRDGRSSTWGISISHRDTTGTASASFAQTYAELDGSANGADGGNPVYSPSDGNRKGVWVQSGSENFHLEGDGKNATLVENSSWAAGTAFSVGQRIRVVASDGKFHLYDVTTAGTTGTSAPVWSVVDGATVTDGSVTWTHLGQFNAGFSKAFFVDGNNYYGDGDSWFDTVLTSNNNVYGAFIDASQVRFIDPATSFTVQTDSNGNPVADGHGGIKYNYTTSPYGAVVRMAADMNIDFSADGTQAGLNKRKMSYVSADKALEYRNPAGTTLKLGDDGSVTTIGVTTVGVGGQSILNSSTAYSFAGMTFGSNLWNDGNNDTDILGGEGGLMLGVVKWQDGHPNTTPALEIQSNNHVIFHDVAQLATMTRSAVLALASPQEGQKVYDTDDHVEVTYRCPTTTTCAWFPTQYGMALNRSEIGGDRFAQTRRPRRRGPD